MVQKYPEYQVINPEDNMYVVISNTPDGIQKLMEVVPGPYQLNLDNAEKYSRRAFVAGSLGIAAAAYYVWAIPPLHEIGDSLNKLIDAASTVLVIPKNALDLISRRSGIEETLKSVSQDTELSEELLSLFRKSYDDQHRLLSIAEQVCTDYDSFSIQFNNAFDLTPLRDTKDSTVYNIRKNIYETMQKVLTGRDVGDPKYIEDFNVVRDTNKQLEDSIRGLEKQLQSLSQSGSTDAEQKLQDYISIVAAKKEYNKRVRGQGIGNLLKKEMEQIDGDLRDQLGSRYLEYIQEYQQKNRLDFSKILPIAAGVVTLGLLYPYVIKPADRFVVAPALKAIKVPLKAKQAISRRKFLKELLLKHESEVEE